MERGWEIEELELGLVLKEWVGGGCLALGCGVFCLRLGSAWWGTWVRGPWATRHGGRGRRNVVAEVTAVVVVVVVVAGVGEWWEADSFPRTLEGL